MSVAKYFIASHENHMIVNQSGERISWQVIFQILVELGDGWERGHDGLFMNLSVCYVIPWIFIDVVFV